VQEDRAKKFSPAQILWQAPLPRSYVNFLGRKLLQGILTVKGLGAFGLITLAVFFTKFRVARQVIRPLAVSQLARAGVKLLPMTVFMALALGLLVIGQTVSLLTRVGANNYLGTVMVTVVVRELGPLITMLVVLARVGTANVIELGTARALGEIEATEALGIDPIHYFVVPRVVGITFATFALTVYLILGAVMSGYLWAFLQDVPLKPGDYFRQLASALQVMDFVALGLKSCLFGVIVAVVTSYHGLALPLNLEEVSTATIRAAAQAVIICVCLDALFLVLYLVG
jgi:phospholipid/cholesterol/gamma-HCH transport system permease protein